MRRPDAKLIDAVVERRTSVGPQTAPSTVLKSESGGDLNWKPISTVSGRGGDEEGEVGSPLRQKLDRREIIQDIKTLLPLDQPEKRSTASKAISALISETSTARRKTAAASVPVMLDAKSTLEPPRATCSGQTDPKKEFTAEVERQDKDRLAVFDFTDSSPADTTSNPRTRINELAKAARNARRHSSVPASSNLLSSSQDDRKTGKAEGALPSLHKRTGSGNVKSISITSSSKSTSISRQSAKEKKPVAALLVDSSTTDLRAKVGSAAAERDSEAKAVAISTLRAERAASRRKSMML